MFGIPKEPWGVANGVRPKMRPPRFEEAAFEIAVGSPLMQCTRLRFYHDEPYSYIINRIPKAIAEQFQERDWETGAILRSLEKRLGLRIGDADQSVRAALADASLARLLRTRIGAPLLSVDRVVHTDSGQAVERVHTYYRSDIYSLKVHLSRDGEPAGDGWTLKEPAE